MELNERMSHKHCIMDMMRVHRYSSPLSVEGPSESKRHIYTAISAAEWIGRVDT
jgi:hypothetical protein